MMSLRYVVSVCYQPLNGYFNDSYFKKRLCLFALQGGLSHNIYLPLVRVDPEQRCACMLIYNRHLVVLPFKHDIKLDETEELNDG